MSDAKDSSTEGNAHSGQPSSTIVPGRGDVWYADLDPTMGREQAGARPVLIVSDDIYNQSHANLVVMVPLTTTDRGITLHVRVSPPDGGVKHPSVVLCDAVRSVSKQRLLERWGRVSDEVMTEVEDRLRILLRL